MTYFSGNTEKKYDFPFFLTGALEECHEFSKIVDFYGQNRKIDDFSIFYRRRSASRVMKMKRRGSVTGARRPELSMIVSKVSKIRKKTLETP